MAVETLTEFPESFIAGDTVRVTIADSRYPATLWTLKVQFETASTVQSFATTVSGTSFSLVISKTVSAAIAPGDYAVRYVFTETASGERVTTADCPCSVTVYSNPEVAIAKTQARLTLEAMELAYQTLMGSGHSTVAFNGQSFTKRNAKEFSDLIEMQKVIVDAEDFKRLGRGCQSRSSVLHPL